MDLTQELPLSDEGELPPETTSFWRRHRVWIVVVAIVVLAGAGGLAYWLTSGSSTPTGLVVTTETASVTTGTIQQTVPSSGTIEPASQASLNFGVSGTVNAVNVKAGQTVTAGEVLATVDTTALSDDLDAAQAQLSSAEARLAADQASSASTTTIDSDQAAVTSAESSLSNAQTALNDASLTSTIAGTVASVSLTVGQQVTGTGTGGGTGSTGTGSDSAASVASAATGSTGTGSSSAQIVVVGTDSYIVNTTVDDTQIGQIADGDQADIIPTGSTTTDYGTVASISLIGSESSDVTTFPVVINVTGDPTGLYAGSTADVSIIVKRLNDVTEVPTAAISYNSSGEATVTQVVNGSHVVKSVTVGAAESGETQITSGVKAGDKVLEQVVSFKAGSGTDRRRPLRWHWHRRPGSAVRWLRRRRRLRRCRRAPAGRWLRRCRRLRRRRRMTTHMHVTPPPGTSDGVVIELQRVTKVYRTGTIAVAALRGISLTIAQGEYVAIIGPSGSGKSTLMHILGCLDTPTSGTYHLAGDNVSNMSEAALAEVRNRRIGFVFQQFNLLPSMSAWQNVELPLVYAGVPRAERKERAMDALARVGLAGRVHHRPGELSGGQQQRVAVARALVTEPDLILADEPTGNLDSVSAADVLRLMDELHEAGRTLVLITHDTEVASASGRVLGIRDGLLTENDDRYLESIR